MAKSSDPVRRSKIRAIAVFIDNGSDMCKGGFAGEEMFHSGIHPGICGSFVGDAAQERREMFSLTRPIERGVVTNWDDMARIWRHMLVDLLKVEPREHPVMMTGSPQSAASDEEKKLEVMFEGFNAPAAYVANEAPLGLYASGRTTGLVLEVGGAVTHATPVYEGQVLGQGVIRLDLAGGDLTEYLMKMMVERGYTYTTPAVRENVRGYMCDIKEKYGYVAPGFNPEMPDAFDAVEEKSYELPDGNVITIGKERFRCAEALFRPSLLDVHDAAGIHEMVHGAIMRCSGEIQKELYCNIVLSGGSTMFPGIVNRMQKELVSLLGPLHAPIRISAGPERRYGVWLGGSILASLDAFQDMWISKESYREGGSRRSLPVTPQGPAGEFVEGRR